MAGIRFLKGVMKRHACFNGVRIPPGGVYGMVALSVISFAIPLSKVVLQYSLLMDILHQGQCKHL